MTARGIAILLFGVGVLALVGGVIVVARWSMDVTILSRMKTPEEQDEWRRLRDPRDDVAEIYGIVEPSRGRTRVIVSDDDPRLITPIEAPERRLLFVDRANGDSVVFADQVTTVTRVVAALLALVASVVLAIARANARRAASGTAPSS